MPHSAFDVILIGAGGMGSAAAFELARRGRSVLALEQFPLVHDRGSSHGHTRIIRRAYYEHPAYVPLVCRAYERWYDLEQRTGRHLLTECDCLCIGPPDGEVVNGVLASAREHNLGVDRLDAAGLNSRFPQFRFDESYVGVLEHGAGFLFVEDCVRAHLDAARSLGATIQPEEAVTGWQSDGRSVAVTTSTGEYRAASLVLTAGPWAGRLLAGHGAPLRVMRQTMLWFGTADDAAFRRDRFPIFLAEVPEGPFYGLPVIDGRGLKVARHYGAPELQAPEEVERAIRPADEPPIRLFLNAHLPGVNGPLRYGQTCIYTLTTDRHFLIDRHPEYANVALAGGFSGHGFKFASVVGEILADLVEAGRTRHPIGMFSFARLRNT
ncbi:MAG TPA: N-methyl-L-tryptophan oxidase [Gemmataceae bacterium]|nr:N-methyl-L-tryptophan oxidase [Gemmataceae bacterium]